MFSEVHEILSCYWEARSAFVEFSFKGDAENDRKAAIQFFDCIRVDIYSDEAFHLADQEILKTPEKFTLIDDKFPWIHVSSSSNYLVNYMDSEEFAKMSEPDLKHYSVYSGWAEAHILSSDGYEIHQGNDDHIASFRHAR